MAIYPCVALQGLRVFETLCANQVFIRFSGVKGDACSCFGVFQVGCLCNLWVPRVAIADAMSWD